MKSAQKKRKVVKSKPVSNTSKVSKIGKVYILSVILISAAFIVLMIATKILPADKFLDFILPEPISFAGAVTISPNAVTLEGEDFSTYSLSGGLQVIDDSTASGGKSMMYSINTSSNSQISLTENVTQLVVRTKGDACKGGPEIFISIDGMPVLEKKVSASAWRDYTARINLTPGSHNISIAFTNDYYSSSGNVCDRNLKVDKLIFQ